MDKKVLNISSFFHVIIIFLLVTNLKFSFQSNEHYYGEVSNSYESHGKYSKSEESNGEDSRYYIIKSLEMY